MKFPALYHVVAMADNRVIGIRNRLPWHFKADLKHFKELTLGATVIMGRKTFESIGRPLAGRKNFVLSRSQATETVPTDSVRNSKDTLDLRFFASLEDAFQNVTTPKAFIVGGARLYEQTLEWVNGIYLTRIEGSYEGDTFYPAIPDYFAEKSRKTLQEEPKLEVIYYENTRQETARPYASKS